MAGPLAAITGATGFLGRRLVPALIAGGWRVRALIRRAPEPGAWEGAAAELVPGDLDDAAALARLADGADVVIHAAGLIKARRAEAFMAVNRDGARRLAEATAGRMVLVSSLAARAPDLSDYAASKRAGEETAQAVLGDRLTVVRPPAVYGPGDRETLGLFRLAGTSPLLPLPGPAHARLALAHVDDVAAAITALAGGGTSGVFAVAGARAEGYAWREIFQAAARAMGASPRLVRAPRWAVMAAAGLSEALGQASRAPPIFTRGKAREILHADWSAPCAEQAPGAPAARFDLDGGFADTVAWYRGAGWLPASRGQPVAG